MLSKISQLEKDKYHMISLLCGIEETKQMSAGKNREATHERDSIRGELGGEWGHVHSSAGNTELALEGGTRFSPAKRGEHRSGPGNPK